MKKTLSPQEIQRNITEIQALMGFMGLDWLYVSSFDSFLNEYTPLENCHRFYVTGFTGSVAEVAIPVKGRVKLYVDGRYQEQAQQEVDINFVEIMPLHATMNITENLIHDLTLESHFSIAYEADRTALSTANKFSENNHVVELSNQELEGILGKGLTKNLAKIKKLPSDWVCFNWQDKAQEIFSSRESKTAIFISAIDTVAWLSQCRGYHFPNLGSFETQGLLLENEFHVAIPHGCEFEQTDDDIQWHHADLNGGWIKPIIEAINIDHIEYDPLTLNVDTFNHLQQIKDIRLRAVAGGLIDFQCIKNEKEIQVFKDSFKKSDQAIIKTIRWVKENVAQGNNISELDFFHQASEFYQSMGAIEQSFKTISGVGPHSSIIHFSSPSADTLIKKNDILLMDSGAYYSEGVPTDTTRTFIATDEAENIDPELIKIHTLVLKGLLQLQNAIFPEGTLGGHLDAMTRAPLYAEGYDYAHGTGHGLGVHVHEGGVRISKASQIPMRAGQVVSMEPGIYLPGKGGVRLENIGVVRKHPQFAGFLWLENMVFIGIEMQLVDESRLTIQEQTWLAEYLNECSKRGTLI